MLNVGALKKLLESVPDDTPVMVQLQPEATVGKATGVWWPNKEKPALTIIAVVSQK